MDNKIITSGGFTPSTINTPIDVRTRVNTVNDIYNINLPYVGMIVYVIDEDKYYKIKTLKDKISKGATETDYTIIIQDALVDTFEKILTTEDIVIELQKKVERLQTTIDELTAVPEIVIANKNIESEMEYLNERTQDENVIGIIINPKLYISIDVYPVIKVESFINNKIMQSNSIIEKNKIRSIQGLDLKFEEIKLYNAKTKTIYFKKETKDESNQDECWRHENPLEESVRFLQNSRSATVGFGVSTSVFEQNVKNEEVEVYGYFVFYFEVLLKDSTVKILEVPYSTKIIY